MGWFDSQIKERLKNDEECIARAAWDLSSAITGHGGHAMPPSAQQAASGAVAEVLAYHHLKAAPAPHDATDLRSLLDAQLRATGLMYRRVRLTEGWHKDAIGAMLGMLEDGTPVALLPQSAGGYAYTDPATGDKVRINARSAQSLQEEAYFFYRPLPLRSLGMKDILRYLLRSLDASDYLFAVCATLAVTLLGLLLPAVNGLVFGPVVDSGSVSLVLPIAVLLVSVSFAQLIIGSAKELVMARIDTKLGVSVEAAAMMRALSLPAPFYRSYAAGDLSARIASVQTLAGMLEDVVLSTGLTSVFSLVYLGQIVAYAPGLAVPALLAILASAAVSTVSVLAQVKVTRQMLEFGAARSGWEYALMTGIQKIRLAGAERRAFGTWSNTYKDEARLTYNGPRIVRYAGVIQTAVALAGTIAIYWFAVQTGVSVADYMAFNVAYGMVSGAFLSLAGVASTAASIRPHLDMARPLLETMPETSPGKQVLERFSGRIELDRVTFRYRNDMPAVFEDFSLKIRPGQYVGIVGKTGCGKSTLIRLMLGFETPQKGSLYYDGRDLNALDRQSVRRSIGTVLQDGKLFTGDIYSNIVVSAPWLTVDDAWKAAEIAGIADDIRAMPMGMHTMISEGAGGISGGQKQRILIARAIAPKPKILMFDEATSALDNITQRQVSEALDALKCTRIVIAHRLSTIRHCDRIVVLDDGRVAEDGTYEELMTLNGTFASLVARQQA